MLVLDKSDIVDILTEDKEENNMHCALIELLGSLIYCSRALCKCAKSRRNRSQIH